MRRRPGAAGGRSVDDVRVRRTQAVTAQKTGDRLVPPLKEDSKGRLSKIPLPRIEALATGATTAQVVTALNTLLESLKNNGEMEK